MTVEEKMIKIQKLLEGSAAIGRFNNPIKEGSLTNRNICGVTTGYTFGLNNLSYRGIWLSTFEDIKIMVDGSEVLQENVVLSIKDMKIPVRDLSGHSEVFWGAEDVCGLIVYQIGGLAAGKHKIVIDLKRRNDFGHTVGNGTQGYEEAQEFLNPLHIRDEAELEVM